MRFLVVYCHPVPESFCAAVRDTVVEAVKAKGCEVRLIDLHAEGFDPVMPADERRTYNDRAPSDPVLARHIEHLRWAEAVLLVYPTWWYGLPAMLKRLVRPRLGERRRLRAQRGRQHHAADDPYKEARPGHDLRGVALVVLHRRAARQEDRVTRPARALRLALQDDVFGALSHGHLDAWGSRGVPQGGAAKGRGVLRRAVHLPLFRNQSSRLTTTLITIDVTIGK